MLVWKELLHLKRDDILHTAAKYGASNVRVFGSIARGEADKQSDLDLLVNMDTKCSLLHISIPPQGKRTSCTLLLKL